MEISKYPGLKQKYRYRHQQLAHIYSGFITLDERVLRADVIARATMLSASADVSKSETDLGPIFDDIVRFRFEVHEYLKGEGADVLFADVLLGRTYDVRFDEQKVLSVAQNWITGADGYHDPAERWWEERESIIFLKRIDSEDLARLKDREGLTRSNHFNFLPKERWYSYASRHYSIESDVNRVWLPSSSAPEIQSADGMKSYLLGDAPHNSPDTRFDTASSGASVSLSELKDRIKAMDKLLKDNAHIEGFEECILSKFHFSRVNRPGVSTREDAVASGLPAGSPVRLRDENVISKGSAHGEEYDRDYLSGKDAHLFEIVTEDEDNDPKTGYEFVTRTKRPVAQGSYSVSWHNELYEWFPCNYVPEEPHSHWNIMVTAPAGTLHEAFFDPVSLGGDVVGADSVNGVLKPAAFSVNGSDDATTIERIDWQDNAVSIAISDTPALANHHIDFIALDGSVSLRLDFDDASVSDEGSTRTMIWKVCEQPWQSGDLLMLRIRVSEDDLTGVTNDTACDGDPTATPTAAPEPEPTAAPTVEPTAIPTREPTAVPR